MEVLKKVALFLFFMMFIYSGIEKIFNFEKKIIRLEKYLPNLPNKLYEIGLVLVILLEIFGSLLILLNQVTKDRIFPLWIEKICFLLFFLFLITVTFIFYNPFQNKKMIPFLANLTTFGGLLYIYTDIHI